MHALSTHFTDYTRLQLFEALYKAIPEVKWLSTKTALAPQDIDAHAHPDSPSRFLNKSGYDLAPTLVAGQPAGFHPEVDRYLTGIYVLHLWLKNDYENFVQAQKTEAPKAMPLLSKERFEYWRKFFVELLAKDAAAAESCLHTPGLPTAEWMDFEKFRALIVGSVVFDLQKSKDWSQWVTSATTVFENGKVMVRGLEEMPFESPSVPDLSVTSRKTLLASLFSGFNLGQDVQFEAPDAMLGRIRGMDLSTMQLYLAQLILDVASAHAVVDPNGARLFHAGIEKSYDLGADNMRQVVSGRPVSEVRRDFASKRIQGLGFTEAELKEIGLVGDDDSYLLAKLVLYSRSLSQNSARATIAAFRSLPEEIQSTLRREFLTGGIDDGWAILIEYGPELFVQLENQAVKAGQAEPVLAARVQGFNLIARIFIQLRTEKLDGRTGNGMLHVKVHAIVAEAKSRWDLDWDQWEFDFLFDGNLGSVTLKPARPPKPRLSDAQLEARKLERFQKREKTPPGVYILRVHETGLHSYLHEVLIIEEYVTPVVTTRVYRREVKMWADTRKFEGEAPRGGDWHFQQIRPFAENVADTYRLRRLKSEERPNGWSEGKIDSLEGSSRANLNDTIYIEITCTQTGRLLGGIRAIVAPYGIENGKKVPRGVTVRKYYGADADHFRSAGTVQPDSELPVPAAMTPEEHDLNIVLPARAVQVRENEIPAGVNIELSMYLIEDDLSSELHDLVKTEIGVQILRIAFDSEYDAINYYAKNFHTYADRFSRAIYLLWGFGPLRDYVLNGEPAHFPREVRPTPILSDGVKWTPMVQDPNWWEHAHQSAYDGTLPQGLATQNVAESALRHKPHPEDGFGPEALPLLKRIFEQVSSPDDRTYMNALTTIVRFAELQGTHKGVLHDSRLNAEQARLALIKYQGLHSVMKDLELQLLQAMKSPDSKVRHRISMIISQLARTASDRAFLGRKFILKELLCRALSDAEPIIPLESFFWLRNEFKAYEILEHLGNYQPELGGHSVSEIKERSLQSLRERGFGDELISEMVGVIRKGLLKDFRRVTRRDEKGEPLEWYDQTSFMQWAGLQLASVAAQDPKIVELFLLATAADIVLMP